MVAGDNWKKKLMTFFLLLVYPDNIGYDWEVLCCAWLSRSSATVGESGQDNLCQKKTLQGRIQDFGKGGCPTMEDSEMSRQSQQGGAEGVAGGECERGLNPLSLGAVWGASPIKVSTFWCFLLQSRHSSALLPGLLIQA